MSSFRLRKPTAWLAVIPWSPLGGGLLTGKYLRDQGTTGGSRYSDPGPIQARRFTKTSFDVIEPLGALCGGEGDPPFPTGSGLGGPTAGRDQPR